MTPSTPEFTILDDALVFHEGAFAHALFLLEDHRTGQRAASGLLLRLNLTTLPAGPLRIRLTAVGRTGNYPGPCVVQARK